MKKPGRFSPQDALQMLKPKHLLILLDYDGTLTDFKKDPEKSNLTPSTRSLLKRLRKLHTLIMVTGRYADSLERVSGLRGIPIVGTHRFETKNLRKPGRTKGGNDEIQFAPAALRKRFRKEATSLWEAVQDLPRRFPGIHIEKKPYSSTLHYRNSRLSPAQIRGLKKEYGRLFSQSVTRKLWALQGGKKMIEAMPKGFSKGRSVREILRHYPGAFPLYAGDDLGDISVLRVLGNKGLRIAVGGRIPDRYCDLRFDSPRVFIHWLKKLA